MHSFRRVALFACLAIITLAIPAAAQSIQDFSFIHASDVHAPGTIPAEVISEISKLGETELSPYNMKAPAPSFVVVSGDVTEFGGGDGAWDAYLSYWKDCKIPVYHTLGNHDGPWFALRPYLYKIYGQCSWSFDKYGCHFIGLDNSTPHDPRANITEEQFAFLQADLKKVKPTTPVFLVIHHPLNDSYFGSPYAVARFIDLLRPYNLVAVLMGHGHSANNQNIYGIDNIQGGAVCGPEPRIRAGFSILSVKDGVLRVAHKYRGDATATKAVIEKPMPTKSTYPKIEILSPSENGTRRTGQMIVRARISGNESPIVKATWTVDKASFKEDDTGANPLVLRDGVYEGEAHYEEWIHGAHYIQVMFTDEKGRKFTKCVRFSTEPEPSRLVWRTFVPGSCRGAATAVGNQVYVGATDMKLYALDKATGKVKWTYKTGGDVCTKPLVVGDTVYVGSSDGKLHAVSTAGKAKWTFATKEGIYSSPVHADGLVIFGCNDTNLYAVDAKTGKQAWAMEEAAYSIEVKPFVDNGTVYFGAWDQYVYAVDVKTGKLKWKCMGYGSETQKAAKRYYSPADCGPVAASGKVFVADRNSDMAIIDAAEGKIDKAEQGCVAVGLAEDGKSVYERKAGTGIQKIDLEGNIIWKVSADVDAVPAAPVEKGGVVYAVSKSGLVQAFSATDGFSMWQYQATPLLYVLSEVEVADGVVYVTGMDGSITAIQAK